MIPTVGRIVHYHPWVHQAPPVQPLAALITHVEALAEHPTADEEGWKVSLRIFYGRLDQWMEDVPFSREPNAGHWAWPPKA